MTETATSAATGIPVDTPCLPGFEPVREAAEPPSGPAAAGGSAPQQDVQGQSADASAPGGDRRWPIRQRNIQQFVCLAGIAAVAAVAAIAAARLIKPRTIVREVVQEIQSEPDGIPLALLPDTADASAWAVVANMSGTIGGTPIAFRRGIARVNGIDYKVCLDFCRSGSNVYVRIAGPAAWIVQVNADGRILRAYPAPKHGRPLKDIFPVRP